MHTRIKSRNVLRVLFFAPAVLSPVVIAFLWKYMLNPQPDAGHQRDARASSASTSCSRTGSATRNVALWAVGLTVVWQFAGYSMVIFLAALQGIPQGARGGGRHGRRRALRSASGTSCCR